MAELEDRVRAVEDHLACLNLRPEWEWACDIVQSAPVYDPDAPGQDAAADALDHMISLYTDDASMELYVPGGPHIIRGKEQIRQYFRANRSAVQFCHTLESPWVRLDGDYAYVRWYTTMYTGDSFKSIAETRDVYQRVNGTWKIKRIAAYQKITAVGGGIDTWQGPWPSYLSELPSLQEREYFTNR